MQSRVFWLADILSYFPRIDAKENFSESVFCKDQFSRRKSSKVQILLSGEEFSELPDDSPYDLLTRDQLLIVIWKGKVQHSAMDNTVF